MNKPNQTNQNNNEHGRRSGGTTFQAWVWISTLTLSGAFFAAGLFYSPEAAVEKKAPLNVLQADPTPAAQASQPKTPEGGDDSTPDTAGNEQVNRSTPLVPSPTNGLSAEELKRFPGAKLKESVAVSGPEKDQITHVRILETDFKYSMIRTEEIVNTSTGELVSREEMVADHILVTLAEGEDPLALLSSMGSQALSMERVSPDASLYRLHLSSSSSEALPKALEVVGGTSSVLLAEPDFLVQANLVPNDPKFLDNTLWGLHQANDVDIDAPEAWDIRSNASAVVVAVIDTGIRYTHQDLAANMWRNSREIPGNRIDDDRNGLVDDVYGMDAYNNDGDPADDHSHGTHCAGTIGAVGNNGVGVVGVAWQVKLMACKFLSSSGGGTTSDAIRCIDYARANGAKIMSNSWGGGGPSASLLEAIERARAVGIIFVAAAGNDGRNTDSSPNYPSCYASDNIISVAATTRNDSLASFSNYGVASVDLGAPGEGILSTVSSSDSAYASYSGTSMATPHVAGALAVLAAQFPQDTYASLIRRLLAATDRTPALQGRAVCGGRLNLARALQGSTPTPPPPTAPANDNFAASSSAGASSWTITGQNSNGTAELGEPAHAGNAASKSVWWSWTASVSGSCTIQTTGSSFDTVLAVYTGDGVGRLVPVVSNDDTGAGLTTSSVSFPARQGVTYRIAVDGKLGASGNIVLRCETAPAGPANDQFAAAAVLSSTSFAVSGTNLNATSEASEPNHAGVSGRKSVWWNYTAPTTGVLTLTTAGSGYDTTLAVYTGGSVGGLSHIASNDDEASGRIQTSRVTLNVAAGTLYRIAVDGYNGASGAIRLNGVVTIQPALGVPSGVNAYRDSVGRVYITWNSVNNAAGYDLILAQGSNTLAYGRVSATRVCTVGTFAGRSGLTILIRAVDAAGRIGSWSAATPVR